MTHQGGADYSQLGAWFDGFINWLRTNNANLGGFSDGEPDHGSLNYWEQAMDYTVTVDNYIRLVMGDEEYNRMKWLMSDSPLVGNLFKLSDSINQMNDYLDNIGKTWKDMMYPTAQRGSGAGVYGSMNFVSSNITRLYG